MTDIKKGLGILFEVVGIILTLAGGFGIFISWTVIWAAGSAPWLGRVSVILVIGISFLVVGIVLRNLAKRKG